MALSDQSASNTAGSQWLLRDFTASNFQSKMRKRGRREDRENKSWSDRTREENIDLDAEDRGSEADIWGVVQSYF